MKLSDIWNWITGRAVRRACPDKRRSRLGVEHLETREVPAVTASLTNGVLTVRGTEGADTIRVHRTNYGISVAGTAILTSSSSSSGSSGGISYESGESTYKLYVPTRSVNHIIVDALGGNDLIDLHSNTYRNSYLLRVPGWIFAGEGNDTIYGTEASDYINSGNGYDRMYGYGGNDVILARVGRDRVHSGLGNDTIYADLSLETLNVARSGRLFFNNSFTRGTGTDTIYARLDLESFGTQLLQPARREVKKATHALDPVLGMLNRPVPVLSNYASGLTYRNLLAAANPRMGQFLNAVSTIRGLSDAVDLSGWIDLGQFRVVSGSVPSIRTVSADPFSKFSSSVVNAARSAGLRFGLLENPASAVSMMMGRNVELMSLRLALPRVETGLLRTYVIPTGLYGVNVEVDFGGKVWATAGATFALDMTGIWNGWLLGGFNIRDVVASVGATVTVKGGVALGIPEVLTVASVKGYGNVHGAIHFGLAGGKKVYFEDLPDYYSDSFRTWGQLSYDIGVEIRYAELRVSYWNGIPYYEWVGGRHREEFGSGAFRL